MYNTQPVTPVRHGTLQLFEDGSFTYIADSGYYGIDYFVYEVCNTDIQPICRKGTAPILILESGTKLVNIAGNDTVIGNCRPITLGGIITDSEKYNFLWKPAEFLNDPTLAAPVFTPGISTEFILTVTGKAGVEITDSVRITVAEFQAEAGTDIVKLPNTSAILDGTASTGENLQYKWTAFNGKIESGENTPNPIVSGTGYVDFNNFTIHYRPNNEFSGSDNFEYKVCNTFDLCDRANVYVMVNDFRFLIPDAFSPNGDNINDYFEILDPGNGEKPIAGSVYLDR